MLCKSSDAGTGHGVLRFKVSKGALEDLKTGAASTEK
jgi:hypothetical protein